MDRLIQITFLAAGILLCLAGLVVLLLFVNLQNPVMAAIAGAVFTAMAIEWFTVRRENRKERQERERVLRALRAELSSLWGRYRLMGGDRIQVALDVEIASTGRPSMASPELFLEGLPASPTNYFAVFDNLSSSLGYIGGTLAQDIVNTYMLAKIMFDSLYAYGNKHNDLKRRLDKYEMSGSNMAENLKLETLALKRFLRLNIMEEHSVLVKAFETTIADIDEALK